MKNLNVIVMISCITASLCGCAATEIPLAETATSETMEETTSESAVESIPETTIESTESEQSDDKSSFDLSALDGTYIELFPEFMKDEHKDWWTEYINAYETDPETVEKYYKMLTESYIGTVTGQEAVDTYTGDSFKFDCFFENDIDTITVDGDFISGSDAKGNEVFSHEYSYVKDIDALYGDTVRENYFHLYKANDEDAGKFSYFAFTDDTPANEYHIEFRYGDNLDDLPLFLNGEYAYWMASGISQDYDEEMMRNCIKLFVDENVGNQ